MKTGWIKLYRQIEENPMYFSEPFTRIMAWIDLLLMANHKPATIYVRGNRIDVGGGQIARSKESLSQRWQWSRGKTERYLLELEKAGQIEQQKSNVITLISISNYKDYQNIEQQIEQQTVQQIEQQIEQQTDINKNDKNVKNDNNINLSIARTREEMEKRGFEAYGEFQNVYLKAVQRRALDERYGSEKAAAYIEDLSCKLEEGSNEEITNSRNHYATLLHWLSYKKMREEERSAPKQPKMKINLNALKPDSDARYI